MRRLLILIPLLLATSARSQTPPGSYSSPSSGGAGIPQTTPATTVNGANITFPGAVVVNGTTTAVGSVQNQGNTLVKNLNGMVFASRFSGGDVGAQVNAAIASLSQNGIVYVDISGGTISTTVTIPGGVTSIWFPGSFTCSVSPCVIVRNGGTLTGSSPSLGGGTTGTTFLPTVDGDVVEGIDTSCCWQNGHVEKFIVQGNNFTPFTISSISSTGGVVTVTTSATCDLVAGDGVNLNSVTIYGVADTTYNGTFPVASSCAGGSSFTYNDDLTSNGTSSGGHASGLVGVHTFAIGETSTVREIVVTNSGGVGGAATALVHEGLTAGTSITEGVAGFNLKGCAFFLMNVASRLRMASIGGDGNPQMVCVMPKQGGGGYMLHVDGMKIEDGTPGSNEPAIFLDGSYGNNQWPSTYLFTNVIDNQTSHTNFILCRDTNGVSACEPDIMILNSEISGYTNIYSAPDSSDTMPLARVNPVAYYHSAESQQGFVGKFSLERYNKQLNNGLTSNACIANNGLYYPSFWNITFPTAPFSIGGFPCNTGTPGVGDGELFALYNSTAQPMTIVNEDVSSAAGNRIKTGCGANLTITGQFGAALFIYSGADSRWILLSPSCGKLNPSKVFVTSDFTDANSASLQAITGLSVPLGFSPVNVSFHCSLMYSQATNVAGDQFGIGVITTAPTNVSSTGIAFTNTGAAAPQSAGVLTGLASTTPTAVVTFQPAVTTVLRAELDGTIETAGAGAATFNVYVLNGTAADVIVVKRGSYCAVW